MTEKSTFGKNRNKQDGPSLESSSYLSLTLRYLGPWDSGTLGPLDLGTLGPLPSFYFFLWFGMGGVELTLEIEIGDGPLTSPSR